MSNLYIGTKKPKKIYVGTSPVKAVWFGTEKVWSGARLPGIYQEVEYIQSHGTEYIDLGFTPTDSHGMKVSLQSMNNSDSIVVGSKGNGDSRWAINTNSRIIAHWNYGAGNIQNDYARHEVSINYQNDRKVYFDGEQGGTLGWQLAANDRTVCLFGAKWGSESVILLASAKLFSCEITQGSNVIHAYVPCYRKADSVIGVYDLVTEAFYDNDGTGTFAKGADV